KDRKYLTQVSRHLEGDLPDGLVGQIQREQLVPAFRERAYGKGLSDTINTYISTLAEKRGFSTDKIFAPGQTAPVRGEKDCGSTCLGPIIILVIVVIIMVVMIIVGRRPGSGGFGGGGGWLPWLLLSLFTNRGGSGSSGWSSGGFGGSDSGSFGGGGFGGFGG